MMEFTYTCSERDFVLATMLLFRKRQRRLIVIIGICAFSLICALFSVLTNSQMRGSLLDEDHWPKLFGLVLPIFICLIPYFTARSARKIFRRTPALSETRTMVLGDYGYSASSPSLSGDALWSLYESTYEDKNSFLLMQKGGQIFIPIPKRELSNAQIDELRTILSAHLSSN